MYLNINPDQLFLYVPLDIKVKVEPDLKNKRAGIVLTILEKGRNRQLYLYSSLDISEDRGGIYQIDIEVSYCDATNEEEERENIEIERIMKMLPPMLLLDIEEEIKDYIEKEIERENFIKEDCDITFRWDLGI
jgi:hypothetical protein